MVNGQVNPSGTSLTKATVGTPQLSASSVTTEISGAGTSVRQATAMVAGLEAVGGMLSLTRRIWETRIWLLQTSGRPSGRAMVHGQAHPSGTSLTKATVGTPQL